MKRIRTSRDIVVLIVLAIIILLPGCSATVNITTHNQSDYSDKGATGDSRADIDVRGSLGWIYDRNTISSIIYGTDDGATADNDNPAPAPACDVSAPYSTFDTSIDRNTRYKINKFLVEFECPAHLNYDAEDKDLPQAIRWAIHWVYDNQRDNCAERDYSDEESVKCSYCKISLDNVNKVLDRYFGFQITEAEANDNFIIPYWWGDGWYSFYKDGYYYIEEGDEEEEVFRLPLVYAIEDLGNGQLKLYYDTFDVYWNEMNLSDVDTEPFCDTEGLFCMTTEDALMTQGLHITKNGFDLKYATVTTKTNAHGEKRYILLNY